MAEKPDAIYGPKIATLMQEMAELVAKESGATWVYVYGRMEYTPGKPAKLKLDINVSPDSKVERLGDGKPRARGSELQRRVEKSIADRIKRLGRKK